MQLDCTAPGIKQPKDGQNMWKSHPTYSRTVKRPLENYDNPELIDKTLNDKALELFKDSWSKGLRVKTGAGRKNYLAGSGFCPEIGYATKTIPDGNMIGFLKSDQAADEAPIWPTQRHPSIFHDEDAIIQELEKMMWQTKGADAKAAMVRQIQEAKARGAPLPKFPQPITTKVHGLINYDVPDLVWTSSYGGTSTVHTEPRPRPKIYHKTIKSRSDSHVLLVRISRTHHVQICSET